MHLGFKKKQYGVALITVMLVVALAAVLATEMAGRLQLQIQRTSNIESNQQALWYALGTEAFAKRLLVESFKSNSDTTTQAQIWAEDEKTFPVELGEITGKINDMNSCLNLNAVFPVVSKEENAGRDKVISLAGEALKRLIPLLEIEDVGEFEAEAMSDALADWIDDDSSIFSSSGAEDDDYASREFAYYTANSSISSINELRVVEHFTPEVIIALSEYVCVLPGNTEHKINVNTLDKEKPELLQALLGEHATRDIAENVLAAIPDNGFKKIDDFLAIEDLKTLKKFSRYKEQFVVDSEYFQLTAKASFNESFVILNSVMKVDDKNQVSIIARRLGAEK